MEESFRKLFVLMLYLAVQQLSPMLAVLNANDVENYIITREGINDGDLYRIVYDNYQCLVRACGSSTGCLLDTTQCICSCMPVYPTFLPELGSCSDTETVKNSLLDGCPDFFEWPFFLRPLNLRSEGREKHGNSEHYQSCYVIPQSAAYYNYQGKNKWVDMPSDFFTAQVEGGQVVFKWSANEDKQLSGRIIRVNISCNYTSSTRSTKTGCLVFKSSGQVTYSLHSLTSGGKVSQTPVFVSSSASSTAPGMASAVLLSSPSQSVSSLQPSTKSPSISINPSSSFSSPQPHQTKFVSTTIPTSATSRTLHVEPSVLSTATQEPVVSVKPTKSSSTTLASSYSAAVDVGSGNKYAQRNGDNKGVITIIGAAGGGALVLGICVVMIIVFSKRRKSRTRKQEQTAKVDDSDIQMGRPRGKHVTAINEQDNEPTYQGLIIIENGQKVEAVFHGSLEDDNTVYQSLNKKIPETPVYQSLKKQHRRTTEEPHFKTQLGGTGQLNKKAKVPDEPVYVNSRRLTDAELGNMPEPLYNVLESDPEKGCGVSGSDNHGDMQDPLYVVLVGTDSERDCKAPEKDNDGYTSDPIYNVLEGLDCSTSNGEPEILYINVLKGSESKQDPQEPLYNVLESSDAEDDPTETQRSYGSINVPRCNVLEEPYSVAANKSEMDYIPSNLPFSLASYDNQAYDQSLELDVAYGIVRRPKPQRESVYEALREPDRCDLYEPLSKRRA